MMNFEEFRRSVRAAFNDDLSGATPETVREFVARLQQQSVGKITRDNPLRLDEPLGDYASIVRNFYSRVLDASADEAAVALWLATAEMAFGAVEEIPLARSRSDQPPLTHDLDTKSQTPTSGTGRPDDGGEN
jgi:hypothetical protein